MMSEAINDRVFPDEIVWRVTVTLQSHLKGPDGELPAPVESVWLKAGLAMDALGNVLNALNHEDDSPVGTEVLEVRVERLKFEDPIADALRGLSWEERARIESGHPLEDA